MASPPPAPTADRSPTIRDIARVCGLGKTTVALALKNSPLVSKPTRQRVQAEAARLGYKVDARVTQLMGYLSQRRRTRAPCNLAWINSHVRADAWHALPWNQGLLAGARERAHALGYALEEIWVRSPDFKLARLPRLLRARGIEGILLPPPTWELPLAQHLPWDDLHTVLLDEPRSFPDLHRVEFDETCNLQLAIEHVTTLGYRRPGLVISRYMDARSNFTLSGQSLADHGRFLPREHLAPFWTQSWEGGDWNEKEFMKWYQPERPDVLLVMGNEWLKRLTDLGLRVPQTVGLVHLHWGPDVASWAGVDLRRELAGSAAIDLLTAHIARGEKGIPPFAKKLLIRGIWQKGSTLRRQPKARARRLVVKKTSA